MYYMEMGKKICTRIRNIPACGIATQTALKWKSLPLRESRSSIRNKEKHFLSRNSYRKQENVAQPKKKTPPILAH